MSSIALADISTRREWTATLRSVLVNFLKTKLPPFLLALVATYGVYAFYVEVLPIWAARAAMAAYESVYISLAFIADDGKVNERRYRMVVFAAVGMSMICNSLFAFQKIIGSESILDALTLLFLQGDARTWIAFGLGCLHGAPLSLLSYNMLQLIARPGQPRVAHDAWFVRFVHSIRRAFAPMQRKRVAYPLSVALAATTDAPVLAKPRILRRGTGKKVDPELSAKRSAAAKARWGKA